MRFGLKLPQLCHVDAQTEPRCRVSVWIEPFCWLLRLKDLCRRGASSPVGVRSQTGPIAGAREGPLRGGESDMDQKLSAVRALVVASPIRTLPLRQPNLVAWEDQRRSADVDSLILAWIASYARNAAQRGRLN